MPCSTLRLHAVPIHGAADLAVGRTLALQIALRPVVVAFVILWFMRQVALIVSIATFFAWPSRTIIAFILRVCILAACHSFMRHSLACIAQACRLPLAGDMGGFVWAALTGFSHAQAWVSDEYNATVALEPKIPFLILQTSKFNKI